MRTWAGQQVRRSFLSFLRCSPSPLHQSHHASDVPQSIRSPGARQQPRNRTGNRRSGSISGTPFCITSFSTLPGSHPPPFLPYPVPFSHPRHQSSSPRPSFPSPTCSNSPFCAAPYGPAEPASTPLCLCTTRLRDLQRGKVFLQLAARFSEVRSLYSTQVGLCAVSTSCLSSWTCALYPDTMLTPSQSDSTAQARSLLVSQGFLPFPCSFYLPSCGRTDLSFSSAAPSVAVAASNAANETSLGLAHHAASAGWSASMLRVNGTRRLFSPHNLSLTDRQHSIDTVFSTRTRSTHWASPTGSSLQRGGGAK